MSNSSDKQRLERAANVFPGGVNSPVRAFNAVGGTPIFVKKAKGPYFWDHDENKYIDYVGSWGPAILGHSHPEVIAAVKSAAESGLSFGAPTELETLLGEQVKSMMPHIEMLRLVSSGTEACMSALRLARAFTKRDKFVKFSGCYHGHADFFLVEAGSGAATLGIPNSPGVPADCTQHTLSCRYNDPEQLQQIFQKFGDDIAGVILEPIVGNSGFIKPDQAFLDTIQELNKQYGSLLIFDEVMTGFRVAKGGAQALFKIKPDLTTLGKVIGGGLPVGAYGGRQDIMQMVAPVGPMYQAGTLSGNPLAVSAGLKTLQILDSLDYQALAEKSAALMQGFSTAAQQHGLPLQTDYAGGMFGFFFSEKPVKRFEDAKECKPFYNTFFHKMLIKKVYLAPSQYEAGFISYAHTQEDIQFTIESAQTSMAEIAREL